MKQLGRLVWLLSMAGVGCVAPVGASTVSIPRDAGNVCVGQCASIGMGLSAVAIMANNIGCVCQGRAGAPWPATPAPATSGGASAAAGMATISMIEAEEQAQQQQQAYHH